MYWSPGYTLLRRKSSKPWRDIEAAPVRRFTLVLCRQRGLPANHTARLPWRPALARRGPWVREIPCLESSLLQSKLINGSLTAGLHFKRTGRQAPASQLKRHVRLSSLTKERVSGCTWVPAAEFVPLTIARPSNDRTRRFPSAGVAPSFLFRLQLQPSRYPKRPPACGAERDGI
ncbi:hypothetical protein PYCCODRAFT_1192756 [Trametes coccinea BRFM310]|uniref:Uncharacterized protein n=1 Tax=Trametes coccinea (strain BRFM310) TaxID=1353009 RepID=A0A1Y2I7S4_TRAC3|nr:hypothetical protein PYCCODRAFT_1192756 [Trametes coccinea BRFM310]